MVIVQLGMIKSNPRMTQSDLQAFRVYLQQKNNTTTGKTIMKIFLGRFETFVDGLKDRDHLLQITKFGASCF